MKPEKTAALMGVSLLALAWGGAASAQETPTAVDEVMVTARQRAENLRDVPAAVSALSQGTLEAAGVARAADFVALTPGVSLVQAAEQGDAQVNIRGVNGARDAQASFAFVVDGVQMANPAAFNREFSDLRQIEVVKGPQGAVYGRNAAAGAIIVSTVEPGETFEGKGKISVGNRDSFSGDLRVAGPLSERISGSLSADFRKTDGFWGSDFGGGAVDRFEGYNFNGRLVARLDEKTKLDLKARYGELTAGSIAYNAVFALPAFASVLATPSYYEDVNDHRFAFQNNVPHTNEQQALEVSAKLEWDLGFATLTAWTLYSDIDNDLVADGTSASFGFFNASAACAASIANLTAKGITLPAPQYLAPTAAGSFFGPYTPTACDGYQYQKRDQSDVSGELRLTSRSDQALRWMVGAYALRIDREVGVATGLDGGGEVPRALYVPAASAYSTEQLYWDDFRSDVAAVFGQLAYDLTPGLEGSLALRYDREERKVHNLVPTAARTKYIDFNGPPYTGGAALNPGLDATINPGGIKDQKKTYDQVQPKIALRWKASDDWTLYGDWGVGFKSGGFNSQGSAATVNLFVNPVRTAAGYKPVSIRDDFDKEVSSSFEIGAKGRMLDGRLTIDAAAYHTDVDDMQFFEFFVGPFGLLRVVSNIDEVRIKGAELGLRYKASSRLTLEASGAYTDSEIRKNSVRPDTIGNESPYTPRYTWNLAADYLHPLPDNLALRLRADVRGTGPTWFHVVQDQDAPTVFELSYGALGRANYAKSRRDAYATLDLRAGLEADTWSVTAFGKNVTGEKYLSEVIPAPEFGGNFASPAAGATFGVELAVKF
ncbi:TonB-dependent receptor [Caulobacter zeae]|nr:TonB-dependent receptor [Caulobacter zeae]